MSAKTTKAIQDVKPERKDEISTTVKGWFSDEDQAKAARRPVLEDQLEDKVRTIFSKAESEQSGDLEQKIRDTLAKVQAEKAA